MTDRRIDPRKHDGRVAIIASVLRLTALALLLLVGLSGTGRAQGAGQIKVTELRPFPQKTVKLEWPPDSPPPATPPSADANSAATIPCGYSYSALYRGATVLLTFSGSPVPTTYEDTTFSYNTRHDYYITGQNYFWQKSSTLVSYPPPYNYYNHYVYSYTLASTPATYPSSFVTVRKVAPVRAQAVDSRLDLRFSVEQPKDVNFQASKYRGGLWAGNNQDGSRVGRTYLGFSALDGPLVANEKLWFGGGLWLNVPRMARTGSATIMSRKANASWSPSSLVWSTAPTLASSGNGGANVSWNAASPPSVTFAPNEAGIPGGPYPVAKTVPIGQWISIASLPQIQNAVINNGGNLELALLTENESGTAWAYFAKPGSTGMNAQKVMEDTSPFVLYAWGGPGADVDSVAVSLTGIAGYGQSGSPAGAVYLSFPAPSGGTVVTLTSSNPTALTVPATVAVTAGQSSALFSVTPGTVTQPTNVTVTATLGASVTTQVTINPSGGSMGTPTITGLSLSPTSVTGGSTSTGTVTLSAAAPTGGLVVGLSENSNYTSVPGSVTVPAGQTTATFPVNTTTISGYTMATITASISGTSSSQSATLTVHQ